MSTLGAGFVRVSTGSQDESSQVKAIIAYAALLGITIVKWFKLHGYSASKGTQEPALREAIADITRGDYETLIVTESSRLDRREDLDAQAEILLAIRSAGGDIISIDEPQFGKTDFAGRIVTLVAQHANAEKSKTVKSQTYRSIRTLIDNKALHGAVPTFWAARGERLSKQAYCTNPEAVRDIYERVANGEPLSSVGRHYDLFRRTVAILIRFAANHTGVVECSYTHQGITETWAHKVEPVVDSALWWRANKVLDVNKTDARANKGGRPIAWENLWISGVLDCPECGGKLFLNAGTTPARNPRTPKLRCGGDGHKRLSCKRFKACDAQPVIDILESMFGGNETPILAFQRVAGNTHELEALKAELPKLQAQLSIITDRAARRETLTQIESLEDKIESFTIVPDSYDYSPTGQTVGDLWTAGDSTVKRSMVRAVKNAGGLALTAQGTIEVGELEHGLGDVGDGIVDLGAGICFRRYVFVEHSADVWPV